MTLATPVAVGPPGPTVERRGDELSAARRLLRRLVEVMAAPVSPQERLDRMVRMIAADIVAEVCSAYVMRAGEYLELFATEGLQPSGGPPDPAAGRRGAGRPDRGPGLGGQSARTRRAIPTSPTGRRPARRSTTPSSACRSCTAAG